MMEIHCMIFRRFIRIVFLFGTFLSYFIIWLQKKSSSASETAAAFSRQYLQEVFVSWYINDWIYASFMLCPNSRMTNTFEELEEFKAANFSPFFSSLASTLIKAVFDFDEDVSVLKNDILKKKPMMELVFNYVDLFFQLIPVARDEAFIGFNR